MDDALERLPQSRSLAYGDVVVAAVELQRLVPAKDGPDDLHVLAGPAERLVERNPVPALADLRPGDPQAQTKPSPGEVVQGDGGHRGGGRGPSRELHDRRTHSDPLRAGRRPGDEGYGVGAIRLGAPHRVRPQ